MPRTLEWRKIIDAKSALNDQGMVAGVPSRARQIKFIIVYGAGTSAGAVQVEEAPAPDFAGTWATLGSPVAWAAANRAHSIVISEPCQALRVRISTAIVGGTVDVWVLITD